MGHSENDAVHKIPHKMKTHWQNQLKFLVWVWFTILYRTRYKKIDVRLVQCPFNGYYYQDLDWACEYISGVLRVKLEKVYSSHPWYWNVQVLVNTGTYLMYHYCLKTCCTFFRTNLCFWEAHNTRIQKQSSIVQYRFVCVPASIWDSTCTIAVKLVALLC